MMNTHDYTCALGENANINVSSRTECLCTFFLFYLFTIYPFVTYMLRKLLLSSSLQIVFCLVQHFQ